VFRIQAAEIRLTLRLVSIAADLESRRTAVLDANHDHRLQALRVTRGPRQGLLDALVGQGVEISRVVLIGGGSRSEAVRRIAPAILGRPVVVAPEGEYVADGAARQAAWVWTGEEAPPVWLAAGGVNFEADPTPWVRERYAEVRDLTARQPGHLG
jgi:molecular chaperone DnaK (HSP70)